VLYRRIAKADQLDQPSPHQGLVEPTASVALLPEAWTCGAQRGAALPLSPTPQGMA